MNDIDRYYDIKSLGHAPDTQDAKYKTQTDSKITRFSSPCMIKQKTIKMKICDIGPSSNVELLKLKIY